MDLISKTPSEDVLRALVTLEHDINFARVTKWLADCAINEAMRSAYEESETKKRWADGRVQSIQYFLKHINEARSQLQQQSKPVLEEEAQKAGAI